MFKDHYQSAADELIDHFESRQKLRLDAKQQRILCTRLVATVWIRTQKSGDFQHAFMDIGFPWIDISPIEGEGEGG